MNGNVQNVVDIGGYPGVQAVKVIGFGVPACGCCNIDAPVFEPFPKTLSLLYAGEPRKLEAGSGGQGHFPGPTGAPIMGAVASVRRGSMVGRW